MYSLLFLLCFASCSAACDSTILALLTGENPNQTSLTKLFSISQMLQNEGSMLNSFNVAAARKKHKEIMANWLQIASDLTTGVVIQNRCRQEYTSLMNEIAMDLGNVRKRLELRQSISETETVHDIIEACITRISVLGAIINDDMPVYEFLKLELMIYGPKPFINEPDKFITLTSPSDFRNKLLSLQKNLPKNIKADTDAFLQVLDDYQTILSSSKDDKTLIKSYKIAYNNLENSFVKLKQSLLADDYFKKK